jgi:hypothetical protein
MESKSQSNKNLIISILGSIITVILIFMVIMYQPDIKHYTVESFTNSTLKVENKYDQAGITYLVLKDEVNNFSVIIQNSVYYDAYSVDQIINANRYVMLHSDGTEEIIYYFTERK